MAEAELIKRRKPWKREKRPPQVGERPAWIQAHIVAQEYDDKYFRSASCSERDGYFSRANSAPTCACTSGAADQSSIASQPRTIWKRITPSRPGG